MLKRTSSENWGSYARKHESATYQCLQDMYVRWDLGGPDRRRLFENAVDEKDH